jgi:hypothetical protein
MLTVTPLPDPDAGYAHQHGQLAPIVENMTLTLGPAAVRDFYLWIFNTLDTELARRVMAAAGKGDENAQRSSVEKLESRSQEPE